MSAKALANNFEHAQNTKCAIFAEYELFAVIAKKVGLISTFSLSSGKNMQKI